MLLPDPPLGLETTLHMLPFQCSMSVPAPTAWSSWPTAQMLVAEIAATPSRALFCVPGLGLLTTLHLLPSQCSMSVLKPVVLFACPTAQTLFVETTVTADR